MVQAHVFDDPSAEVEFVARSIAADVHAGLRPDDIMVLSVDDRYAKRYLSDVEVALSAKKTLVNNAHTASSHSDFHVEERVTLTTVHKAKGNEAFMVYVMGVDALDITAGGAAGVRARNTLFTALTRAKGWVRATGVRHAAKAVKDELAKARAAYPRLNFTYPSDQDFTVMRHDLEEAQHSKLELERLLEHYTYEEIDEILKRKRVAGGGKRPPKFKR